MTKKLLVTIFMLVSAVSNAQPSKYHASEKSVTVQQEPAAGNEGYEEIETVENNIDKEATGTDTAQEDYFKGANDASNTQNSPQINIYNANSNANKQNQKNKIDTVAQGEAVAETTVNTDADLGASYVTRANDIRNARKSMEIGTEQKMVEKIEWSRMEDEKDRAARLFGDRLDKKQDNDYQSGYGKTEKPSVIIVEKQPTYEAPAQAAPAYDKYEKQEVTTAAPGSWWGQETYVSPLLGTSSYSSASNVSGNLAMGAMFGTRFDSNFSVDASFVYSDYSMDDYQLASEKIDGQVYPGFKNVDQYNFMLGVKYNIVQMGRLMPHIGGLLGYTYREFNETRLGTQSASSTAVDAGISLGADLRVSKNFSVGAEYRIIKNISYSRDNSEVTAQNNQVAPAHYRYNPSAVANKTVEPMEALGYQMFLLTGKFSF